MSMVGVIAPTWSSLSKPPALAVHVLAEAFRQLLQRMSVVNMSANMPLV